MRTTAVVLEKVIEVLITDLRGVPLFRPTRKLQKHITISIALDPDANNTIAIIKH